MDNADKLDHIIKLLEEIKDMLPRRYTPNGD